MARGNVQIERNQAAQGGGVRFAAPGETTQGKFFNYEIALEAGYADGSVFYRSSSRRARLDAIERVSQRKPHPEAMRGASEG